MKLLFNHHKLHRLGFDNNYHAKSIFPKFVWNKHGCQSSIYIVWTSILCTLLDTNVKCLFILFTHGCRLFIHDVYTLKSCTWLPCLNNSWHLCLSNINLWEINFTWIWNEPMKPINLWWCGQLKNGCPWKNTIWIRKKVIIVWIHSEY